MGEGRATADRLIDLGEQALTDLNAWADATGRAAESATRDAIAGLTGMIESAAAMGDEAVEAASAQAEQAADAAEDFVEQVADTVGEAAQDATDFLFG